jgi:hypothetical protein
MKRRAFATFRIPSDPNLQFLEIPGAMNKFIVRYRTWYNERPRLKDRNCVHMTDIS